MAAFLREPLFRLIDAVGFPRIILQALPMKDLICSNAIDLSDSVFVWGSVSCKAKKVTAGELEAFGQLARIYRTFPKAGAPSGRPPKRIRVWVLPPPSKEQSILGVLLRGIYNYIVIIIQLLLRGGSTQIRVNWVSAI